MALNTFSSHLSEVGASLQELMNVIDGLEGILNRHNHNNYGALSTDKFDSEVVTKAQYDAAMVSVTNLLETWLPGGHGTQIDNYLYEVP